MDNITINSGHVANAIDSQLIQLVRVLQIENECNFDDALTTGRDFLNKKVIELMHEEDIDKIKEIAIEFRDTFKKDSKNELAKSGYTLCKYFGIYKYLVKG